MGDVVLSLGEHDVSAVVVDDAHVFDPRAGEDRVFGIAGPVNAVARGGQAQRHGRRAVAGVAGVPETIGSIVADQDIASLADLAVPGVAAGAGEDRVLGDRRPGGQAARRAGLLSRPAARDWRPVGPSTITKSETRPRRVKRASASMNHLWVPPGCRWPGVESRCRSTVAPDEAAAAPGPSASSSYLAFSASGGYFKSGEPNGAVAQLGERRVRNAEVEGSIPFRSIGVLSRSGRCASFCRSAIAAHIDAPRLLLLHNDRANASGIERMSRGRSVVRRHSSRSVAVVLDPVGAQPCRSAIPLPGPRTRALSPWHHRTSTADS